MTGFFVAWSIAIISAYAFMADQTPQVRSLGNAGGDLLVVRGGRLVRLKAEA